MATPEFYHLLDLLYKFLQTIVLPVVGYVAYLLRTLRDEVRTLRDELRTINGRITKLEERAKGHEKLDDDRFIAVRRELDQLHKDPER